MLYRPPPGYIDLLSDAERVPLSSPWDDLDVPTVGVVRARKPQAVSVAYLAMAASPDEPGPEQISSMVRFVSLHLDQPSMERLYLDMMMEDRPAGTIEKVGRAVATWGTARPYVAVVTLAVMAGYHWRTLRQKLLAAGVADPLASIPSLHALLDFAEEVVVDGIVNNEDARAELDSFYRRMYGPSATMTEPGARPAGFSDEEVESSFDAFARVAR